MSGRGALSIMAAVLLGAVPPAHAGGPGPSPGVEAPAVPIALREADARRRVFEPQGAMLGATRLDLAASVAATHDDNIYGQHSGAEAAWIGEGRLDGSLRASNDTYTLTVSGDAATVHAAGHADLDHRRGGVAAALSWQAYDRSHVTLEAGWRRRVELPGDPDLLAAAGAPVAVDVWRAGGDGVLRRGLWLFGGEMAARRLNHHDTTRRDGGRLEQDDRDRWDMDSAVRAGLAPWPTVEVYLALEQAARVYDRPATVTGFQRDSVTDTQWIGLDLERSERLAVQGAVGRATRRYTSPWFDDLSRPVWRGAATVALTSLTTLSGGLWQRLEETGAAAYSGIVVRGWQAGVRHELLRNLMLRLQWRAERRTYEGPAPDRTDRRRRIAVGGTWKLDGRWGVAADAVFLRTDSSIPELDSRRRRITLRLTAAL